MQNLFGKFDRYVLVLSLLITFYSVRAQEVEWNVHVGGGITFVELLSAQDWKFYEQSPGASFQLGTSASSLFGDGAIVGWEAGVDLVNDGFYSVPLKSNPDGSSEWDYDNKESIRDWYVKVPVSLTFDFFERVGFLTGVSMSRRISHLNQQYNDMNRLWLGSVHLGVYGKISDRLRLDITPYLDLQPRKQKSSSMPGIAYDKARRMGGMINLRYTIR